jgi:ectoine hydroxylase-related dioxygenase (phytanoyl-CoA dioxygenase family)
MGGAASAGPAGGPNGARPGAGGPALTPAERADFVERGVSGVFSHPLLAPGGGVADRLLGAYGALAGRLAFPGPTNVDMERRLDAGMMWFQSTFVAIPELYEVASHPAIVGRVASILGPDLLVWATTVLKKQPGEAHLWHTDTAQWEGVTAFVGLRGMSRASNVKAMTHTHRLAESPYDLFTEGQWTDVRGASPLTDEAAVLAAARRREPRCELVAHDMGDGEFFLFDGLTWHGSRNESEQTRHALAIFYARPDADVRIPTAFGKAPTWYGEKPPCVLVAGVDRFRKNRLVAPPARPPAP